MHTKNEPAKRLAHFDRILKGTIMYIYPEIENSKYYNNFLARYADKNTNL